MGEISYLFAENDVGRGGLLGRHGVAASVLQFLHGFVKFLVGDDSFFDHFAPVVIEPIRISRSALLET